jgi:hypothetical protein
MLKRLFIPIFVLMIALTYNAAKAEGASPASKLVMEDELSEWNFDEKTEMIYAISRESEKLLAINSMKLGIDWEYSFSSAPADIEAYKNRLYIALPKEKQIIIIDKQDGDLITTIKLKEEPYQLVVGKNGIFFTGEIGKQLIYFYGEQKKRTILLSEKGYHEPALHYDSTNETLYIGESNVKNGGLFKAVVDGNSFSSTLQVRFDKAVRNFVYDQNALYFGGYKVSDFSKKAYQPSTFITLQAPLVFYKYGIINQQSKGKLQLPYEAALALKKADDEIIIYSRDLQTVFQYEDFSEVDTFIQLRQYEPADLSGHWAKQTLKKFNQAGFIKGFDESGEFLVKPNDAMTRAEFTALLTRALGLENKVERQQFTDVAKDDWYFDSVHMALGAGLIELQKSFRPNAPITRAEAATIIHRLSTTTSTNSIKAYRDIENHWAEEAIENLLKIGVVEGFADDSFRPDRTISRGEAVVIVDRALALQKNKLPSDQLLKNTILSNEYERYKGIKNEEYWRLYHVASDLSIGYYNSLLVTSYHQLKSAINQGYTADIDYIGEELEVNVLAKSDTFATIELKDAVYQISYTRDDKYIPEFWEYSGVYQLRKMADGSWKIYSFR